MLRKLSIIAYSCLAKRIQYNIITYRRLTNPLKCGTVQIHDDKIIIKTFHVIFKCMRLGFCKEIKFVAFWATRGRSTMKMEALNNNNSNNRHRETYS